MSIIQQTDTITISADIRLIASDSTYDQELFELISQNKASLSQYMDWPKYVASLEGTQETTLQAIAAHNKGDEKRYYILYQQALAGIVSFNNIEKANQVAYFGYWLGDDFRGKGLVTKAVNALVEHYHARREIQRFVIKCSTSNPASNAVAKRCGFEHEGTAEYINGTFYDQNIYALIKPLEPGDTSR